MVTPLMLIKILHCKRTNGRHKSAGESGEGTSHHKSTQEIKRNAKKVNADNLCRVCLKEGNIPIHGNNKLEDISEALNTFGAIDVRIDDPYPKYLCEQCSALLQGAILLRKTAQRSDILLKNPPVNSVVDKDDNFDYLEDNDNYYEQEESKVKKQMSSYYLCKKCEISFDTFNDYNEHILSEEHENMRILCTVCNKSYTPLYYKKHSALHRHEAPYMCDICGKSFIMQGHFTRHRLTHFYKLPYKCSLCPYKGRFSESLKMHMRTHTGEKPYQCTQCPSRFINKSNLNKHMLTHKGEHDFKCDSCGRGFYTKRELELHFKVDHTGIKDHVCNICGKAFGYRKQMMKHQLKVHKRAKLRSGRMPLYLKVETMKEQGQNISVES